MWDWAILSKVSETGQYGASQQLKHEWGWIAGIVQLKQIALYGWGDEVGLKRFQSLVVW